MPNRIIRAFRLSRGFVLFLGSLLLFVSLSGHAMIKACTSVGSYSSECTMSGCTVTAPREVCEWIPEASDYAFWAGSSDSGTRVTDLDAVHVVGSRGTTDSYLSNRTVKVQIDPCDKQEKTETTDHPVDIPTGNKVLPELDFLAPPYSGVSLMVSRSYDKSLNRIGIFGKKWASSIEYTLSFDYNGNQCHGSLS